MTDKYYDVKVLDNRNRWHTVCLRLSQDEATKTFARLVVGTDGYYKVENHDSGVTDVEGGPSGRNPAYFAPRV